MCVPVPWLRLGFSNIPPCAAQACKHLILVFRDLDIPGYRKSNNNQLWHLNTSYCGNTGCFCFFSCHIHLITGRLLLPWPWAHFKMNTEPTSEVDFCFDACDISRVLLNVDTGWETVFTVDQPHHNIFGMKQVNCQTMQNVKVHIFKSVIMQYSLGLYVLGRVNCYSTK